MKSKLVLSACLLLGCLGVAGAQENYFNNWPAGTSPAGGRQAAGGSLRDQSAPVHQDDSLLRGLHLVWRADLCRADPRRRSAAGADQEVRAADAGRSRRRANPAAPSCGRLDLRRRAARDCDPDQRQALSRLRQELGGPAVGESAAGWTLRPRRATGSTTCTC